METISNRWRWTQSGTVVDLKPENALAAKAAEGRRSPRLCRENRRGADTFGNGLQQRKSRSVVECASPLALSVGTMKSCIHRMPDCSLTAVTLFSLVLPVQTEL
jgi:hypothetical protein